MRRPSHGIRCIARTTIYRGRTIQLIREVLEIHGQRIPRETIVHPGSVVIVPMLDRSRCVFVRQYRRAVRRSLLELPAGTREPGEPPQRCARRELEEETGWRASRMRRLSEFYAAPGFLSERMTVFLASGLTRVEARPEPDERLTPVVLSLRTAVTKIGTGEICDAKTIIGVLTAKRLLSS